LTRPLVTSSSVDLTRLPFDRSLPLVPTLDIPILVSFFFSIDVSGCRDFPSPRSSPSGLPVSGLTSSRYSLICDPRRALSETSPQAAAGLAGGLSLRPEWPFCLVFWNVVFDTHLGLSGILRLPQICRFRLSGRGLFAGLKTDGCVYLPFLCFLGGDPAPVSSLSPLV